MERPSLEGGAEGDHSVHQLLARLLGGSGGILWQLTHCGQGVGEWKIVTSRPLIGKGIGTVGEGLQGTWYVDEDNPERDVKVQYSGTLSVTLKPARSETDIPQIDQLLLQASESSVEAYGEVFRQPVRLAGLTFVAKTSDTPCRPEDEGR